MAFLSIVMPVFNAEKTLHRAVFSILNQTFYDFELVIVDDRSTDSSLNLSRELERNDPRIKVIALEKNSGASAARNAALDRIDGRYVTFVDADDWIEDNLLSLASKALRDEPAIDCLKCGCSEDYFDRDGRLTYRKFCRVDNETISDRNLIRKKIVELESVPLFGYVWNGFYRVELLKNHSVRFDEARRVNEDFFFNADFFRHVKVLRTLDCMSYRYEKRGGGSLSSAAKNYSYEINRQKIETLLKLFDGEPPRDSAQKIFWMYARFCFAALVGGESIETIRRDELFARFRSFEFEGLSFKRRVMVSLLRKNFLAPFLSAAAKLIGGVKKFAPTLFARLKQ